MLVALGLPDLGDPAGIAIRLTVGLLARFLDGARGDITSLLDRYLFTTADTASAGGGALTANPSLRSLNHGLTAASDVLVTAVVLYASLRSVVERTWRSRYTLRLILPHLLLAIVLAHGSLALMQLAIDLNNALGHVALSLGGHLDAGALPWSSSISADSIAHLRLSDDLFHGVFSVLLVIALVILALAYVVRMALLNVLIVVAPLAALCTALPATQGYARTWWHLFVTTVFMQAVQLIVLRVASVTALDAGGGIAQEMYALATLYILLRVPGALNTAAHLETKAKTMGRRLERSLSRAMGQPARR